MQCYDFVYQEKKKQIYKKRTVGIVLVVLEIVERAYPLVLTELVRTPVIRYLIFSLSLNRLSGISSFYTCDFDLLFTLSLDFILLVDYYVGKGGLEFEQTLVTLRRILNLFGFV